MIKALYLFLYIFHSIIIIICTVLEVSCTSLTVVYFILVLYIKQDINEVLCCQLGPCVEYSVQGHNEADARGELSPLSKSQ